MKVYEGRMDESRDRVERVPDCSRVVELSELAGIWSGLRSTIPQFEADRIFTLIGTPLSLPNASRGNREASRDDHDFRTTFFLISKHLIRRRSLFEINAMGDHERGINLPRCNLFEQGFHVTLHVSLAGLHREPFVHESTERYFIREAHVFAGDGNGSSLATAHDCLSQHMSAICGEHDGRLHFIERSVQRLHHELHIQRRQCNDQGRDLLSFPEGVQKHPVVQS